MLILRLRGRVSRRRYQRVVNTVYVSQRCRIAGLRCAYLSDHNQMTASVNQFLNTTGKYGCLIQRRGDVRRARAFYSRKPVVDVVILSPGKAIGDVNLLLAQYIYAKFVVLFYGFRNKLFGAKINEHRGWGPQRPSKMC